MVMCQGVHVHISNLSRVSSRLLDMTRRPLRPTTLYGTPGARHSETAAISTWPLGPISAESLVTWPGSVWPKSPTPPDKPQRNQESNIFTHSIAYLYVSLSLYCQIGHPLGFLYLSNFVFTPITHTHPYILQYRLEQKYKTTENNLEIENKNRKQNIYI